MVPRVGIEPTLLSEPDFESGASTYFTTEAYLVGWEGVEPSANGLKVRCSTTELPTQFTTKKQMVGPRGFEPTCRSIMSRVLIPYELESLPY